MFWPSAKLMPAFTEASTPCQVAQATGRTAYVPGAGLRDRYAGTAARLPLQGHWTLFGGLGVSQLQGDAAASPLTGRKINYAGSLAIAWRSR